MSHKHSPGPDLPVIPRAAWLRLAADEADRVLLRADARCNLLAVARVIAWSADKQTGRSRPTMERIIAASRLCRRTVQTWSRWLEEHQLLTVLEEGATPRYRPSLRVPGARNMAREWRLAVPPVRGSCAPPSGVDLDPWSQRRHAREDNTQADRRSAADSPTPPSPPRLPQFPSNRNPQRRRERLAAAEQLRRDLLVLRRMSARAVRSAVRAYFQAGWTVADIEHALDHLPDGSQHIRTDAVHSPARWLAWRLGLWRSAEGTPLPPHSAELAARAQRHQAGQAERRQVLAELRAQAGNYAKQAAWAREMLANRSRST